MTPDPSSTLMNTTRFPTAWRGLGGDADAGDKHFGFVVEAEQLVGGGGTEAVEHGPEWVDRMAAGGQAQDAKFGGDRFRLLELAVPGGDGGAVVDDDAELVAAVVGAGTRAASPIDA